MMSENTENMAVIMAAITASEISQPEIKKGSREGRPGMTHVI